jgi:hypothetical protein
VVGAEGAVSLEDADTKQVDIGHGVTIQFTQDKDGERVGLIEEHPADSTETGRCVGSITFDTEAGRKYGHRSYWTVESMDPLTLSPSLLCITCGHHGFIRGGKWVPA